ncbi:MAG TPA: thioredoxin-disulfide reductase [Terriglobia bacterium]|nr:thioredoxin-disulfide reductase [Terriglobia bacterium]
MNAGVNFGREGISLSTRDVVIIGSGCAGLTAAIYTARANLKPLVIEGVEAGGQLSLTTLVENFPGFPEGVQGPELIQRMKDQAARFGAEFAPGDVTAADLSKRPFTLMLNEQPLKTRTLIIASGASARWLGLPNEKKLIGKGVSSCATCDGFFFRGKDVIVVGGGDTAMEDSLFLTRFVNRVDVVHRRDTLRASKIMADRARANEKIHFIWDTVVEDIYDVSKDQVTGVKLRNLKTNEVTEKAVSAVFVAIGHVPNSKIFKGQLEMDAEGYLKTHDAVKTNIEGVYACGDVQDRVFRQAITAAGTGCAAAILAERFLEAEAH